mgnify:CR=1 FL=1
MSNTRTAVVTFFPIMPNNMGSSTVVNSRFISWPKKKKLFQISHIKEVNNKNMQKGNTSKMIFNINYILSYLSNFMSLQPGDIVTTGTPPGVGMGKKPQVF